MSAQAVNTTIHHVVPAIHGNGNKKRKLEVIIQNTNIFSSIYGNPEGMEPLRQQGNGRRRLQLQNQDAEKLFVRVFKLQI